jgi:hypothetical protein
VPSMEGGGAPCPAPLGCAEGGLRGLSGEGDNEAGASTEADHPSAPALGLGGDHLVALAGIPGALRRLDQAARAAQRVTTTLSPRTTMMATTTRSRKRTNGPLLDPIARV